MLFELILIVTRLPAPLWLADAFMLGQPPESVTFTVLDTNTKPAGTVTGISRISKAASAPVLVTVSVKPSPLATSVAPSQVPPISI